MHCAASRPTASASTPATVSTSHHASTISNSGTTSISCSRSTRRLFPSKPPPDRILIPGVVSHCVYQVEHPELVAQRIERFAGVVGRENVIAGNDCGFATSAAGDEVHPDVAWAKLDALSEGARIASKRLWG